MGRPMPEKDMKKRQEVVCSILEQLRNKLLENEVPGDATKVITYGSKEEPTVLDFAINQEESIQIQATSYEVGIDENDMAYRKINGKKVQVNEILIKEIAKKKENIKNKNAKKLKENREHGE